MIGRGTAETLPLGRRLIKLTVDTPPGGTGPSAATGGCSGWRPCWPRGGTTDLRGLDPDRARAVSLQASLALIRAAIS